MSDLNDRNGIELSIIVAVVSDTTKKIYDLTILSGCLQALEPQVESLSAEIIVPYPAGEPEFEKAQSSYPEIIFFPVQNLKNYPIEGSSREHHDELRAHGIAAARGEIIALIEDYARPDPSWSESIITEHNKDLSAIGGAIENEIDRPLNWGVYFCDFGKYQNPVSDSETTFASDANISYKNNALMEVRSIWQNSYHETEVNWALRSRGEKIALSPKIVIFQHRTDLQFRNAMKERYVWGRSYAATRIKDIGNTKRFLYLALTPFLPFILVVRMTMNVLRKRRNLNKFLIALPLTILLEIFWSFGEFVGYLTGRS
jgi:hypothetical protein